MIFICNKLCANIDQNWQTQTDLIISSLKIKEFSQKLETSFRWKNENFNFLFIFCLRNGHRWRKLASRISFLWWNSRFFPGFINRKSLYENHRRWKFICIDGLVPFCRIFPISNFKIGGKIYQNQQVNNGLLQIDCGTYGMDWISISICQFIAEKLVKEDSPYDILIFPVLNPDGYEYSRNTDRLWQKNYRRIGTRAYNIFLF